MARAKTEKKAAPKKKAAAKRSTAQLKSDVDAITKPAIQRLARRGGVKRLDGKVYDETRGVMKVSMEAIIRDALTMMHHDKRKMLMAKDILAGIEATSGKHLAMAKGQKC